MNLDFSVNWLRGETLGPSQGAELLRLLRTLRAHRSLREAAEAAGLSYRFAWGLLTSAAAGFGSPLVELTRGRGAVLTQAGLDLLALDDKIGARLAPVLGRLSAEVQPELSRLSGAARTGLVVHASHDLALVMLRDLAAAKAVALDLHFHGSETCLDNLAGRRCDVAGFHTADEAEGFGPLRADRHKVVLFALREQGLMVRPGSPVKGLKDLTGKKVRFINRQKGSGTRTLFDRLIGRERIDPAALRGYADEEFTHLAVAATVATGHADAGFGIQAAAAQYQLGFIPIATERYGLACTHAVSESPAYGKMLALLRSRSFRTRASALPGYDVSASGTPLQIPK
jgi:putative molybdopterin biosynthesis protein